MEHTAQWVIDRALAATSDRAVRSRLDELQVLPGCSHPYEDDKPMVLGNWNDISGDDRQTMSRVYDLLLRSGYKPEWSDQWYVCTECGRGFCNYKRGLLYGIIDTVNCECICAECIMANENIRKNLYVKYINSVRDAWTFDPGFNDDGYVVIGSYRTGMMYKDNPHKVVERLSAECIDCMFYAYDTADFFISWRVVVREQIEQAAKKLLRLQDT